MHSICYNFHAHGEGSCQLLLCLVLSHLACNCWLSKKSTKMSIKNPNYSFFSRLTSFGQYSPASIIWFSPGEGLLRLTQPGRLPGKQKIKKKDHGSCAKLFSLSAHKRLVTSALRSSQDRLGPSDFIPLNSEGMQTGFLLRVLLLPVGHPIANFIVLWTLDYTNIYTNTQCMGLHLYLSMYIYL